MLMVIPKTLMDMKVTTSCDWCMQEGVAVQAIDKKLWRFWGIISDEDPPFEFLRSICEDCMARYERFSTYINRCKSNESVVEKVLASKKDTDSCSSIKEEYPKEDNASDVARSVLWNFWDEPGGSLSGPSLSCVQIECSHCNKTFANFGHLRTHLRAHTGERPFKCSYCNKTFARSCDSKRHLRFHKEHAHKSFKCYCNTTFARSGDLRRHLRVHKGDKPYKCQQCDKTFARSNGLKCHLRVHTGEKPFKCSHCDKTFARSSALKCHLRIHTREKPFKCSNL